MAIPFGSAVDLLRNELLNARIQNLASAPSSPVQGLVYFDTSTSALRFYDGTEWVDIVSQEGLITQVNVDEPITSTGGSSPTIGITDATTSARGAMTSGDKTKLDGVESGATANSTDAQLRDRSTHTGVQAISTVDGLQGALDSKAAASDLTDLETEVAGKQDTSEKGQANGYASLDANALIPTNQLPALAITSTFVVADLTARDALTVQEGDVAIVSDASPDTDGEPASYIYDGTVWQKLLTPFTGVAAVTGGTGIDSTGGDTPEISITPGGVGTTELGDDQVTEPKLHPDVRTKLNAPGGALKYAETIGDGTTTSFTITHSLSTRDVAVTVRDAASPYAEIITSVEMTTENAVTVSFDQAPGTNEFRVVVVG